MTLESQVASLTTATTSLLNTVNVKKSTLDASVATATTKADVATTKAGEASDSASSALAIYGNTAAMNTAVSTSTTNAATATTKAGEASTSATAAAASAASAAAIVTGVASNRPSVRPSLLIDFAATGKLDPRIAFGRSSPAMAYDGKTTVKAEENLLPYAQDFTQASWTKNNTTITANTVAAPDGTTTASTLAGNAGTLTKTMYCNAGSTSIAANNLATQAFFVKYNTHQFVQLYVGTDATDYVNFDLVNGLATAYGNSTTTGSITNAGNGWWRISMTWLYSVGASTGGSLCLVDSLAAARGSTSASTNSIYVWGAQLEQRAYATAYTPTTTAAITNYIPALQSYAANVARFDFNPVTGESLGLMVEEQRANLLTYSQDFTQWVRSNVTAIGNAIVAPDGTLTGNKLTSDSVSSVHWARQIVASGSYTFSGYFKSAEYSSVVLLGVGGNYGAAFNLSAGTVGTIYNGATAAIIPVGNGWYRCAVTMPVAGTDFYIYLNSPNVYSGDGKSGIYAWGAQLEAGAFATSYIPTLLTYSGRGSTATYIGDNGLIQTAAANVARYQRNTFGGLNLLLEGATSNLLPWTQQFTGNFWDIATYPVIVIPNSAIAPDGTLTADLITASATNTRHIAQYSTAVSAGATYTASIYVKRSAAQWVSFSEGGDVVWHIIFADLTNGTITSSTNATGTITYVSGGWYRLTITLTRTNAGTATISIGASVTSSAVSPSTWVGTGNESIYVWGAQLETGSVATSYIPSTETFTGRSGSATYFDPSGVMRTAPAELARYDFDPVTKLSKGLLIEAAATNLITYADDQANAAWTARGCTVTSNAIAAPDGTTTADKLVEDSAASTSHGTYRAGMTMTAAAYTLSIFARAAERTFIKLVFTASGDGGAYFNLGTGAVATVDAGYTATIQDVGGGYYRCSITVTCTAATWYTSVYLASADNSYAYNGNGTSGAYVWGAQLELGSVATSYIPTTSAQVTRAADVGASVANSRAADVWSSAQATRSAELPSMTGTNFSSWFRKDSGSLFIDAIHEGIPSASSSVPLSFSAGAIGTNSINICSQYGGTGRVRSLIYSGSTVVADMYPATVYSVSTEMKISVTFANNDYSQSVNGGAVTTVSSGLVPVGMDRMYIGCLGDGTSGQFSGYIKRIAFYPKRLTNTELQGLTS